MLSDGVCLGGETRVELGWGLGVLVVPLVRRVLQLLLRTGCGVGVWCLGRPRVPRVGLHSSLGRRVLLGVPLGVLLGRPRVPRIGLHLSLGRRVLLGVLLRVLQGVLLGVLRAL